jgi:hypothetical protein
MKTKCNQCGNEKKNFMHNCPNQVEYTEIFGCPVCDDDCGHCKE